MSESEWGGDRTVMGIAEGYVSVRFDGRIVRISKNGGEVSTVCEGSWDVRDILVDDDRVYFNDFASGDLWAVPKAGGTPWVLASPGTMGNQMAMDEGYIYFSVVGGVQRIAKSGGSPELITSESRGYALAVDDDYVYWGTLFGTVQRVRKPD